VSCETHGHTRQADRDSQDCYVCSGPQRSSGRRRPRRHHLHSRTRGTEYVRVVSRHHLRACGWSDRNNRCGVSRNFHCYGRNKPISPPRQGFDITRLFGIVPKRCTNLIDAKVDAPLKIDKGIIRPKPLADFLASDHVSCALRQHKQDFYGLKSKLDGNSRLAQFAAGGVQIERTETNPGGERGPGSHGRLRRGWKVSAFYHYWMY